MDHTALIQSAQHGNLDSFNQLVLAYQDRLFNVALYMLDNEDSAADALQNAFILAFRNLASFRGGAFDYWLLRILKNVCYDELRRRKRQFAFPLEPANEDDESFETPVWLVDHAQGPAELAEQMDLTRAIQDSLQTLSPDYRMVVTLVDIDGMDYSEAAAIINKPIGTVKSRLARARMRLREELRRYMDILPSAYAHSHPLLVPEQITFG